MRKVYRCEHTVPPVWWFTFADRNALGEEIVERTKTRMESIHFRQCGRERDS